MNGKQIASLLAIAGVVALSLMNGSQSSQTSPFEAWKKQFGVKYDSMFEQAYREKVFLENLAKIELHNSNKFRTYEMGINQFSALTQEEFQQTYLGLTLPEGMIFTESSQQISNLRGDIDWVSQGAVTAVKNQGQCGSCWAFSTTGGLQGMAKVQYGDLPNFSEQQLVDCSSSYGNQACNGGLMTNSFKYVKDKGIVAESAYPYKAVKQACSKDGGDFKISGFTEVKNCNDLATALTKKPISVAVDASNWSAYKSGTFNNCRTSLNHGVTLVGVKSDNWVIKNSWGPSWGEKGFITLSKGNTCGVCNMASYPNK